MSRITPQRVRELLIYCPITGHFKWRVSPGRKIKAGSVAGGLDNGYIVIGIGGLNYFGHRLAWAYMLGRWPDNLVDHENRVRSDNRWINLRAATYSQNNQNKPSAVGVSRLKGVHRTPGSSTWSAKIQVNKEQIHLGSFPTAEEAHAAYVEAAKKHHGKFSTLEIA